MGGCRASGQLIYVCGATFLFQLSIGFDENAPHCLVMKLGISPKASLEKSAIELLTGSGN